MVRPPQGKHWHQLNSRVWSERFGGTLPDHLRHCAADHFTASGAAGFSKPSLRSTVLDGPILFQGTLDSVWGTFVIVTMGLGRGLLASSGQRPGMLPRTPQRPGHLHPGEQSSPNIHSTEVRRAC